MESTPGIQIYKVFRSDHGTSTPASAHMCTSVVKAEQSSRVSSEMAFSEKEISLITPRFTFRGRHFGNNFAGLDIVPAFISHTSTRISIQLLSERRAIYLAVFTHINNY